MCVFTFIESLHSRRFRGTADACTLFFCCLLLSGCASIVNPGARTLPFNSMPDSATIEIFNENGERIAKERTPYVATLSPKSRYFRGARYRVRVTAKGYEPQEINIVPSVNGWYFGNIIFGGLIGMLVVDPLTGAMYNLKPEDLSPSLAANEAGVISDGKGFKVVLSTALSESEQSKIVPLNDSAR